MTELAALYATEDGTPISTQSMLKCFRLCPKQTDYKYFRRLKPKSLGRPLREGDWGHKCLETHYKGGDWKETHGILTEKWEKLFDEEKDRTGNMPDTMSRLLRSYFWHYANDPWEILDVEVLIEVKFPNGSIFRLKADLVVRDQYGIWIVDHKFNAKLPDWDFRLLDLQGAIYTWAGLKSGLKINGFIWNYIRRKAPSIPTPIKDGSRLSKTVTDTDYPTLYRAIKKAGLDPRPYQGWLDSLKAQRFVHGDVQRSEFFRRSVLERENRVLKQFATEAYETSKRMHEYPFGTDRVERHTGRHCKFMCSYSEICTIELLGGNTKPLVRQRYEEVDPLYYYEDDPKDTLVRGED
jgi:hypothetical protein